MKFFFSIVVFIVFCTSLYSSEEYPDVYPKKIVFGTYSKENSAKYDFNNFRRDEIYKKLYEIAIKNDFAIHYRPLAKYTILVIEPLRTRKLFYSVLNLIKKRYPKAYHLSAEGLDVNIQKPLRPLAPRKKNKSNSKNSVNAGNKEQTNMDEVADEIEKPIFKVEKITDKNIAVNPDINGVKKVKESNKTKEIKQEIDSQEKLLSDNNGTIPKNNNEEIVQKTDDQKVKKIEKRSKVAESKAKDTQVKKEVKQEESFFSSILNSLNFFKQKSSKNTLTPEQKDVKKESEKEEVELSDETALEDMDVPELSKTSYKATDTLDKGLDNNVTKAVINVKTDANLTQSKEKSIDTETSENKLQEDNQTEAIEVDTSIKVQENNQSEVDEFKSSAKEDKEQNYKQMAIPQIHKIEKKTNDESESSYFTFSNIIIGLFLIFLPYFYKKFKKFKTVYDEY